MSNEPTWVKWRGKWHAVLARSNYEQPGYTACDEVWTDKQNLTRRWSYPQEAVCCQECMKHPQAFFDSFAHIEGKPLFSCFPWPH